MIKGTKAQKFAQSYINRCNSLRSIQIATEEYGNVINWFNGLQSLGLLDSLIDGWTLRSSQNAGGGTKVFSFKDAYNLTLVDGPVWGVNGIVNSANGYAQSSNLLLGPNCTVLVVSNASSGNTNTMANSLSDINTRGFRIKQERFFYGDGALQSVFYDMAANNVFQMVGGSFGARLTGFKNGVSTDLGAISPVLQSSNPFALFGAIEYGNAQQIFVGQISFAIAFSTVLTDTRPVYELYKATIGKGLGLP